MQHILIVDDDRNLRQVLTRFVKDCGYEPVPCDSVREAAPWVKAETLVAAIVDIRLGAESGLDLLKMFSEQAPGVPVLVVTAERTPENAIVSMREGAFNYLTKPFDLDQVEAFLAQSARKSAEKSPTPKAPGVRMAQQRPAMLVGVSAAMQEVFKAVGRVAQSEASVLIHGESGTGKELVARALHEHSRRHDGPFIAVNMAAIPVDLVEAELFGYEAGAFTGAVKAYQGRFGLAHGGTIFLDEIGDMPLSLQAKLLRVLQEHEITRIGGVRPQPIDVRVVSATQVSLEDAIAAGRFRADLYYRLEVVPIHLPALRERPEDIPMLAEVFLERAWRREGGTRRKISPGGMTFLQQLPWPGNVRQLENLIQRTHLLSSTELLTEEDFARLLSPGKSGTSKTAKGAGPGATFDIDATVQQYFGELIYRRGDEGKENVAEEIMPRVEKAMIEIALRWARGNQLKAAALLGYNRNTLRKRIAELSIAVSQYKPGGA